MHIAATVLFCGLAFFTAAFQLALAAGMAWGTLTWGGRFPGRLPGAMRGVALISATLLLLFALIVAVRAGAVYPEWQPLSRTLVWVVVSYCGLGVLANAATPSRAERRLWLPVIVTMLLCSGLVAAS